jgi:hypothetical protein
MFFSWEKHIIDLFDVKIALHFAQAPSKNPKKWLIMCFSQLKKHKIPKTRKMADYVFSPPKKHKILHL